MIDYEKVKNVQKKLHLYEYGCYEDFKNECLEALGITDHPKADALWDIAWECAESSGACHDKEHKIRAFDLAWAIVDQIL